MAQVSHSKRVASSRAWYEATIQDFLQAQPEAIVGRLAASSDFAVLQTQSKSWQEQISILREQLSGLTGGLFLEFNIPRMGRRIDTVLVIGPVIFVVEFKVGEGRFDRVALDQTWDYALDLKNFHEASHRAPIVPILVATEATAAPPIHPSMAEDKVFQPLKVTAASLRAAIDSVIRSVNGEAINTLQWSRASYRPTPTIIEAARTLYAQHSVDAITRYDAGAKNLHVTSRRIEELIYQAKAKRQKLLCLVTGVPGAGKTLVGLNVATRRHELDTTAHAVFLSGNGPLVAVLREALTRDEVARRKAEGNRVRKSHVAESVKAFIQNVHHFRDDALADSGPPVEHVAIFDEAQRAWNLRQTASFMQRKKNRLGFAHSEAEFLISCLDRRQDWAVIVCLVGGGQEINRGEAGIDAWIQAVHTKFSNWHLYISSKLTDSEYSAGRVLDAVRRRPNTHFDDSLHLSVSMRSFRAENVSAFVKALLDCEKEKARAAHAQLADRFPIMVTRDLSNAKKWIRSRARGTEQYGLVASSKALRLKPHAVDVRVDVNPVHWFLNDRQDTRSSYYLEDAATEFQVQGLELDWTCVTWDGDLRFNGTGWSFHDFRGNRWINIKNLENQNYLRNAYRVLLTRARQGMVIFVPQGDSSDHTRRPEFYDATFQYLTELGIPALS